MNFLYDSCSQKEEATPTKLFYKGFSPRKLNLPYVHEDLEQLESCFEDLKGVEQRLNAWLNASGEVLPAPEYL